MKENGMKRRKLKIGKEKEDKEGNYEEEKRENLMKRKEKKCDMNLVCEGGRGVKEGAKIKP